MAGKGVNPFEQEQDLQRWATEMGSLEWSLDHPQARIAHLFDD